MKITRILPRFLAIGFQEYDLSRTEQYYEYHQALADVLRERVQEGREELQKLKEGQ